MIERARRLIAELFRQAMATRVTGLAAEVTFFAVFSLFPGLLFLAGALGSLDAVLGHDTARLSKAKVLEFLGQILTIKAQNFTDSVRDLFDSPGSGLMTFAAIIALYTVSTGFASLIESLDLICGVCELRSWLRVRVVALGLALDSMVMLALMLAFLAVGPLIGVEGILLLLWGWVRPIGTFLLLVVWVTTIYHIAPNRTAPWLRDLPGGILAAVSLLVFSYGFGLYVRLAASVNEILGVLGGGLILMMWLYALSLSVLLGAVLNNVVANSRRPRGRNKPAANAEQEKDRPVSP